MFSKHDRSRLAYSSARRGGRMLSELMPVMNQLRDAEESEPELDWQRQAARLRCASANA
jgi:hypothetical protein